MSNYLSEHHEIRVLLDSYLTCPSVSMTELHYLSCIFPIALAIKMSLSCWDVPNPHIKLSREYYSKLFTAANHGSSGFTFLKHKKSSRLLEVTLADHKNIEILLTKTRKRMITAGHLIKKTILTSKWIYLNSLKKWQQILAIICCKYLSLFYNSIHSKYPE